jgi:RNA polymerase sigma factor (sigma-70 family)
MPFREDQDRYVSTSDEIEHMRSAVDLVLRRLIGAHDPEYEDLAQSALEHVLSTFERGKFRGDCPTGGWAAVIARNVAVDAIRTRMRERQIFALEDTDHPRPDASRELGGGERSPEHLTDVQCRIERLKKVLSALSPQKANVVYLHDVLGYPLGEIAGIVRTSVAAAQSRLVRARREIVDSFGGVTPPPARRTEVGPTARKPARRRPPHVLS